jgi:hypothetical protein
MLPQELIRKKRDGQPLTRDEVKDFIAGLTTAFRCRGGLRHGRVLRGMEPQRPWASPAMRDPEPC